MAIIMTIKINRQKLEAANLEYLRVRTLTRWIKMLMERRGFKPIGNGTWEHEREDVAKIVGEVMLDLEEDDETLKYIKTWKIKATHEPYVYFGEYDLLQWYEDRRKPFYEKYVLPQKIADRKIRAAQLKARILRKIGKLKNTDDTDDDTEPDAEPNSIIDLDVQFDKEIPY